MGLRLKEGIAIAKIEEIINKKFTEIFEIKKLAQLQKQNLVMITDERIIIPQNRWLVMNSIISKVSEFLRKR